MSGIAGIWNLDGAPADAALLEQMTSAIADRGPDGIGHMVDGTLGIGHCMLCTTPESLRERQPLWDESHECCLALDGRIDNRQELSAALKSCGSALRDDTDAELLLKAYLVWGSGLLSRIAGDFAFVVWEKRRQSLFCARDHLGIRPLYYYTDGKVFLWASELHPLLHYPGVPSRPNEHLIAEFLADCVSSLDESLYLGIRRLPPACSLTVLPGKLRVSRYWEPSTAPLRYRRESDYADHLRVLLTEAVRCRLRSHAPVAAELSGGLDSSTVVTLAKPLADAAGQPFEAASLVYPGLLCDESAFIDAVAAKTGVSVNKVVGVASPGWVENAIGRYRDFPGYPNGEIHTSLWKPAVRRGCRVVLTGLGGDEWFDGYAGPGTFGLLRERLATYPALRLLLGKPPLLPWIDPGLRRRANLYRSYRACAAASRSARTILRYGPRVLGLEIQEKLAASVGVELRHPFNDVRVVAFAARIPADQLQRGPDTKWVLRESMRGLLPEPVRTRCSKAEFSHVFAHALCAFDGGSLDNSRLLRLGYLADRHFSGLWSDALHACRLGAPDGVPHLWKLWNAYALNTWIGQISRDENHSEQSNALRTS